MILSFELAVDNDDEKICYNFSDSFIKSVTELIETNPASVNISNHNRASCFCGSLST